MRLLLIIGILAMLSMGVASAAGNNMTIAAGTNETFADDRNVQIVVNFTNATGHPVNDTRVNFTTTLGTLSSSYDYTNAAGIAVVRLRSWDLGTANVTAQAPNATNATNVSVNVTFVRGPVSKIVLTHNFTGTANTTHLVTATVYDQTAVKFFGDPSKWRELPNVTLNFSIAPPPSSTYNSANITPSSNITDESGVTTAIALIDKCAGNNLVTVNVTNEDGHLKSISEPIVGEAGEPTRLFLDADPQEVVANNIDTSRVTGTTTDEFLNPLLSRGLIRFNTTDSVRTIPLDGTGRASITIGPNIFTGNVTVNGTYINESGYFTYLINSTVVNFYAEEPVRIVLSSDVRRISTKFDPKKARITAIVVDEWGHALTYTVVNFSRAGVGDLTFTQVNTLGVAQAVTSLSSATAGDVIVTASTKNDTGVDITASITINVTDQAFVSVNTTIAPDPVPQGGIINVTTIIEGHGNITGTRDTAHAVLTLDRSGSMDPDYYAGTPLDIVEVLDRSGSMSSGGAFVDAQKAATMFLDNMVSNSQVGVVSYSTDCTIDYPLTLLNASDNKPLIKDAINALSTGGDTAMGDGMLNASRMLDGTLDPNARNYTRKIMIVLTDGRTNVGAGPMTALGHAQTNGITIYTIGLGSSLNETLLRYIAYETGGKYYNAPESSELQGIYQRIAQEISDYDITAIEYSEEGFTPYNYEESPLLLPVNRTGTFTLRYYASSIDNTENNISVNGHDLGYILSGSGTRSHDITAYVVNGTNTVRFYQTGNDDCCIQDVLILADNVTIASYPGRFYLERITGLTYNCTFTTTHYTYNDTFLINETVNDLKTTLDWSDEHDLDLHITDPDGHIYGEGDDTTGYYFDCRVAAPIDPEYCDYDTYISSLYPDTNFRSENYFHVCDRYNDSDSISSSILRFTLPANEPTRNAQIDNVVLMLRLYNHQRFRLEFEGYDMDEALSHNYSTYHSGGDGSDPWWDNGTAYTGECRIRLNGANYTFIPDAPTPANNETWVDYGYDFWTVASGVNTVDFTDWFNLTGHGDEENRIRNVTITYDDVVIANYSTTNVSLNATPVNYTFSVPDDPRYVRIHDMVATGYTDSGVTWNNRDGSNPWDSGSNFSTSDYNPYTIGSLSLESRAWNGYVRTDITDAIWDDDRTPDWGESCNLALIGEGYDGNDTYPWSDRFRTGYSRIEITYSIDKDTSESIWVHPLPGGYLNNTDYSYVDYDNLENMTWGNWSMLATGTPDDLVDEPDPSVAATDIWFTANLSASSSATYYMYYGNPAATSQNYTGGHVFTFFEDFEDGMPGLSSFRLSTWDDQEGTWDLTPTVVNHGGHSLHLTDGNSWKDQELPEIDLSEGYALGFTARTDDGGEIHGVGVHDGTGGSADALCYRTGGSQNWGDIYLPHADAGGWTDYEVDLTTDWSDCQGDYETIKYITYIADDDADASIDAFWDYIYVRKHVATDPTATVGSEASGTWLNGSAWTRRMPINLTEQSGTALTTYPVKITIDTPTLIANGSLKSDLSDIRIIDDSGNEVPWTPRIRGRSQPDVAVNLTNHIDKKSATQLASHAFISSLDHSRNDTVGMITYSYKDPADGHDIGVQQSYVCEGNQWEGYFTANATDSEPVYHFSLDWSDASDLDLYLYDGVTLLDSSVTAGKPERVAGYLTAGRTYRVLVNGTSIVGDDTQFTIDVSKSPIQTMCTYYDDGRYRDPRYSGRNISRYRYWTGSEWTGYGMHDEGEANPVEGRYDIYQTVLRSAPTRNESILGTIDFHRDLNTQVWNGSEWGEVVELSTSTSNSRRSFDIAYEQSAGRAMVVYRNNSVSNTVPAYALWDGTGWTHGRVQGIGTGTIILVRLVPKLGSDEIMLVTMDTNYDIYAQVWDGSSWGNVTTLTTEGYTYDWQCFDIAYENATGDAMVVWAENSANSYHVRYRIWNGAWIGPTTIRSQRTYQIRLASDPNSDRIVMGALEYWQDVNVSIWDGSAWGSHEEVETESCEAYRRCFDVTFEQNSGDAIVVWGDYSSTPKYRIWNGTGWGTEQSASGVGHYSNWVRLATIPHTDELFLMTANRDNDINTQKWDGSSWSAATEVEIQSSYDYERFAITVPDGTSQVMCVYYDYAPNSKSDVPRYKLWDGSAWSGEYEANPVCGNTYDDYAQLLGRSVIKASPTSSEIILGTIDYANDVNVQIWDDTGWSSPRVLSNTTYYYRRAFDIAYEQLSGRAIIVYKGDCDTNVPEYRIWDGSTLTWTGGYVNSSVGDWMAMNRVDRLIPKPGTNEILLLTMNWDNDLYAQIWNGSAWGDSHLITATARTSGYQCFDAAYEYGTGEFVVVWSNIDTTPDPDVYEMCYCTYNGTWSPTITMYQYNDTIDRVYWVRLASDPNSNNIIMGTQDRDNDDASDDPAINVSIWDGSSWSQQLRIEDHAPDQSEGYRYFDVAFEQTSGEAMIAWSDDTYTPKYRIWNGTAWDNETSASNIGYYTRWVRLEPDPLSDEIFLMTSDRASDINIQRWDGSAWSDPIELESRSSYSYECFDIACRDTTSTSTTVNWVEWRAVTDVTLIQSSLGFDAINESVDSLTADGMTAIDEGLFNANNALHDYFNPEPIENGTIVLMTDGIDNVGYHSMIKEAEYAASNDTKIYAIGFGSGIDDRILRQIANITGGTYYFAPNATVLKEIFEGIAGELSNFTAANPEINLHLGNNTSIEGAWTNVTYIDNSSNITYFNCTCDSCDVELGGVCKDGDGHANGTYWNEPSPAANPAINTSDENLTRLNWSVGNRFPPTYAPPYAITTERSWTVRYQLQIGEDCAGVIDAIIDPSFDCGGGHGDDDLPDVTVTVGGNASDVGEVSDAANCTLNDTPEYNDPPEGIRESAFKIEAKFTNSSGAVPDVEGLIVEFWASTGTLTNYTLSDPGDYSQPSNHVFCKWGKGSTWPHVRLRSTSPGSIRVWSSCLKEDGEYINASTLVTFHSTEAPPIIPPAPRPRGVITLE